jgi:hypothetical protein
MGGGVHRCHGRVWVVFQRLLLLAVGLAAMAMEFVPMQETWLKRRMHKREHQP